MAIRYSETSVEIPPMHLSVQELERIIATSRIRGFRFRLAGNPLNGYRYFVSRAHRFDSEAKCVLLMSNDIADVARFIGIPDVMADPLFTRGLLATLRLIYDEFDNLSARIEGPVDLQMPIVPNPCLPVLPLRVEGGLDYTSQHYQDRVQALHMKTRQPLLDCRKVLQETNGNVEEAVVLLERTEVPLGRI